MQIEKDEYPPIPKNNIWFFNIRMLNDLNNEKILIIDVKALKNIFSID